MGFILAVAGLTLSVIDYFGFAASCEAWCMRLRDRLDTAQEKMTDVMEGKRGSGWLRMILIYGGLAALWVVLMLLGAPFRGEAGGLYVFGVTAFVAALFFGPMLFNLFILALHLLAMPRKGLLATLGLLLAVLGVWIEMAR